MRVMATTLIVLVCAIPALRAEDKTPADQLKEIRTEWSKALQDWNKEYLAAKPEERAKLLEKQPKPDEYIKRAMELAEKNTKDQDVALEALFYVISLDRSGTKSGKAFMLLAKDFAASDKITTKHLMALGYSTAPEATEFLNAVASQNKDKDLQGAATYVQGQALRQQARMIENFKNYPDYAAQQEKAMGKEAFEKLSKQDPADLEKKAEKQFVSVTEKYKDVEVPYGRNTVKLGKKADGQLFEIRNLTIGKTVPDEALELLDGKKVKLSDYRGKVVVIDMWATWCGPCRAMIPHEREMVEKLSGKPFVLMSISADAEKSTLEKFLEKEKMPWTHVHNGATGGIVEKWNISYFPTIYVIDAKGVIRHKDIRDKKLEEAVEKLLKEAEEASKKSS